MNYYFIPPTNLLLYYSDPRMHFAIKQRSIKTGLAVLTKGIPHWQAALSALGDMGQNVLPSLSHSHTMTPFDAPGKQAF